MQRKIKEQKPSPLKVNIKTNITIKINVFQMLKIHKYLTYTFKHMNILLTKMELFYMFTG